MKKIKRITSLFIALILCLSLCACGDEADGHGIFEKSGPVTISIYRACFNAETVDEAKTLEVQNAINEYIADKIDVQIALKDIVSTDYTEKLNIAINQDEVNLFWTAAWEPTVGTYELFKGNAVRDITDFLPETALYGSMEIGQWGYSKYNQRNYFVPVYKDCVEGYDLMFRQDLVDKFGWKIDNVSNLSDLRPMLEDAKNDGLKYPFLLQKTAMFFRFYIDSFDFFTGNAESNWISVDRSSNQVVDTILTPEYSEFCKLMAEYSEAGYISVDDTYKKTTDATTQSQDWAISWWTDLPNNDEADTRYGQDVTVVPITDRYLHTDSNLGSCFGITADSTEEETKACIDFLGLLFTDKTLADMYTYGIEGTDFSYDPEGYVVKAENSTYKHSVWESAPVTVVSAEKESPFDAQMYIDFNASSLISVANGFKFDKSPVAAQFTACQEVFNEYGFALETGGFTLGEIDDVIAAYQNALDAAGYQDVLEEAIKQYDAWK